MPIGHIGLNVRDMARAKAYYDELMPLLGFEPFIVDAGQSQACLRTARA